MDGTCNNKHIFVQSWSFFVCLCFVNHTKEVISVAASYLHPTAASPQITASTRTNNPKTQDSFFPNDNVSPLRSSQKGRAAPYQISSVQVVICMKCCVSSLVFVGAADASDVGRVHILGKRKWEGLMALMEQVSELLETILVMGDWAGKEPRWQIECALFWKLLQTQTLSGNLGNRI